MKEKVENISFVSAEDVEKYEHNITEFSKKKISLVIKPKSHEELQIVVKEARIQKRDLFVISTGKNWGLGSKQPLVLDSAVVDLHRMNRIVEVNESFRYAIIEPGVTQKQLSDYLLANYPDLKFPVTGSGEGTSIVGNMLERGVTVFGHRNQMIVAMEILLASGEVLHTGFWHYLKQNNPLAFHYPYGHGPDLRGLFTQSNMGITTKMVIRLQPRLEGVILILKFKKAQLKTVINLLKQQHENKLLDDGVIITNENDPRTIHNNQYRYIGNWLASASFSGDSALLKCKMKLLRKQYASYPIEYLFLSTTSKSFFGFRKCYFYPFVLNLFDKYKIFTSIACNFRLISSEVIGRYLEKIKLLKSYYHGIPSNYSIERMAQMNGTVLEDEDIDNSNILGISLVLPALPIDGDAVIEVSSLVNKVSKKWGFMPFHNFASVGELAFEGFYRIYFDRKDAIEVQKAHSWSDEIHQVLRDKGYIPYRLDNEHMNDFVNESDVFWKTIKKIKNTLDECDILARGKYNLNNANHESL